MVASAAKKTSQPAENVEPKSHPAWTDMITECITTTQDGPRHGVSRPAIKKFVDSKYHLPMNAAATSRLNRAIAHGTVSGDFTLPKGPSGKVKLAPKSVAEDSFLSVQNPNSPAKRPRARQAVSTSTVGPFAEEQHPPATKKYTSMAKKARVGRQKRTRSATKSK